MKYPEFKNVPSYRQTEDSAVFGDAELFQLWSFLLWNANWREGQLSNGKKLAPGQLVIFTKKLARSSLQAATGSGAFLRT